MLNTTLHWRRHSEPRGMGQVPAHKGQGVHELRRDPRGDRARDGPHGRQQQGHLSRAHQPQDILHEGGQSDAGGPAWDHQGKMKALFHMRS